MYIAVAICRRPPPLPSSSSSRMRNLDNGTDDGTDGWKGRPPPDRLRILYKKTVPGTGQSEPAPTSAPTWMDGALIGFSFLSLCHPRLTFFCLFALSQP